MKYSPDKIKEICQYIRAGNNYEDSALLADITEKTFYEWKKTKSEFCEALKKAETECKARNIAIIQKAAETSWQAAAWWLERKYNSQFALKQLNEFSGVNGEPIKITVLTGTGFIPSPASSTA